MADDDPDPGPGRESISKTLRSKVLGVPILVPLAGGVLFAAWYIHRRAAASAAAADGQSGQLQSAATNPGLADSSSGSLPYMGSPVFLTVTSPNVPSSTGTGGTTTPPAGSGSSTPPIWSGPAVNPATHPLPSVTPPAPVTTRTYVVQSGDTLSAIARSLGVGGGANAIYNANRGVIEQDAQAHHLASSDSGHWIYPGERLVIPT